MISRITPSRRIWISGLLLFAATWLFYSHTLSYDFVWDDFGSIVHNQALRGWSDAWKSFYVPPDSVGEYDPSQLEARNYRPLRTVIHAAVYHAVGLHPGWYHLLNVTGHAAVALLLFFIFLHLTRSRTGAAVGTIFFAFHPALTEPVCWAKSFEDMLAALFCLAAFLCFEIGTETAGRKRFGYFGVALLLYLLALTAKMSVVFLPVFLLLRWCFSHRDGIYRNIKSNRAEVITIMLLAAVTAAGLAVRHLVLGHTGQGGFITGNCWTTWLSMPRIFVRYLFMEFLPFGMLADYEAYPRAASLLDWSAWLYTLIFLFLLIRGSMLLARTGLWQGWLWFWCALLPFFNLIPMVQLGADRFLYLPTIGISWLVAELAGRYLTSRNRRLIAAAVLALFAYCAWQRSQVWRNERTLWEATVKQTPNALRPQENLIKVLIKDRDFAAALKHAGDLAGHSSKPEHQVLFGYAQCLNGDYGNGLPRLIHHRTAAVLNIVGVDAINRGRNDIALQCFAAAVGINPTDPRYRHNLDLLKGKMAKLRPTQ